MDCSTPGFPVHHQLLELAQTHVHRVSDAIQPSHPLSSPSPPTFNLSQHLYLGCNKDYIIYFVLTLAGTLVGSCVPLTGPTQINFDFQENTRCELVRTLYGLPRWHWGVKNLPVNEGDIRDVSSIPELGRSPGEGEGNPLQYPSLENLTDRGAWRATVQRSERVRRAL